MSSTITEYHCTADTFFSHLLQINNNCTLNYTNLFFWKIKTKMWNFRLDLNIQ